MDCATGSSEVQIDVCVCTFQRPQALRCLLQSLAEQRAAPCFRVLVVDNAWQPAEAAQVLQLRRELGLQLHYLHAPGENISVARNAGLEHAQAPLLAFIDDDEIADPDWLACLHKALDDLDVVFGPVHAQYPDHAPQWMRAGDFHSKVPAQRADRSCATGHTANVLLRRDCIGASRFEPRLGRSGGEDTLFFAMLAGAGARLGFSAVARVFEPVETSRAQFGWLRRRAYGSGQAHARMALFQRRSRLLLTSTAGLKIAYCALLTLLTLPSAVRWRRHLLRGCLHLGVLATALGASSLTLYGQQD